MILLLFLLVSTGMNGYVLARLFRLYAVQRRRWLYALPPLLSLSTLAALALEARVGNWLTGGCYSLAMGWLGLCWLLLPVLGLQQLLGRLAPLPRRTWAIGIGAVACLLALYSLMNARTLVVRREAVPGLPVRIVHLSDLHVGSIGRGMLREIVATTNRLQPDLVLITGDLFDNANPTTRAAAAELTGFSAPVLFTSGNHEEYAGLENVRQLLLGSRIRWLRDEAIELAGLRIVGVDNSYGTERLRAVLARLPAAPGFTLLMNHQPLGFDLAADRGAALMLCGHVHNGQLWPFGYVVGAFYPYRRGLHRERGSVLNVSTGTGFWGPPMRLGSHSEIVLLEPSPR